MALRASAKHRLRSVRHLAHHQRVAAGQLSSTVRVARKTNCRAGRREDLRARPAPSKGAVAGVEGGGGDVE